MMRSDSRTREASFGLTPTPTSPDVVRMPVVEDRLRPKRTGDRQVVGLAEALQVVARGVSPARTADDHERPLCAAQKSTQSGDLRVRRRRLHRQVAERVGDVRLPRLHVLGQREHDRAGTAAGGDLERTRNELGHAGGIVDLRYPLGHRPEHAPVVDLLEGFALGEIVAHLADEEHAAGWSPGTRCERRSMRWSRRDRG